MLRSRTLAVLVAMLTVCVAGACRPAADTEPAAQTGEAHMTQPIEDVLARHAPRLMQIAGVVGVGQGLTEDGEDCLKVLVVADTPELRQQIPAELEGYPVVLRPTGELEPK